MRTTTTTNWFRGSCVIALVALAGTVAFIAGGCADDDEPPLGPRTGDAGVVFTEAAPTPDATTNDGAADASTGDAASASDADAGDGSALDLDAALDAD